MDEPALIREAQGGDLDAFNRLVLEYQTSVFHLACRIMGEEASAADATQEAFINAYKHISYYRGGSFRAWLFRIVTNACYDELRRRKRRPATSLEELTSSDDGPDDASALLVSKEESPEAFVQRREVGRAIQDCLDKLPADMRAVVVMSDIQGLDYSEIAESVDTALGTVKSRLSRARARLRDCLQNVRELLPAAYRLEEERI